VGEGWGEGQMELARWRAREGFEIVPPHAQRGEDRRGRGMPALSADVRH
jgi:hypothetical protein